MCSSSLESLVSTNKSDLFTPSQRCHESILTHLFSFLLPVKLVWVPNENFDTFVLVDDDGKELARGTPTGSLPHIRQRQRNYAMVRGGKYASVVESIAQATSPTE